MGLYQSDANRRKLISNYNSQMWVLSGQEKTYAKVKSIILSVTDYFLQGTIEIYSDNGEENR